VEGEAKFAVGALGTELIGEVEGGSGAGGYRRVGEKSTEGEQAGGLVEVETGSELAGGGAEDTAAGGGIERAEAIEFDGNGRQAGRRPWAPSPRWRAAGSRQFC